MIPSEPPPSPPPLHSESCGPLINDPPPPYPSRERRARATRSSRRGQRLTSTSHAQLSSTDSHSDYEVLASPQAPASSILFVEPEGDVEPTENTPLLVPPPSSPTRLLGRPRTLSHTSTILSSESASPSLAQTVFSLFQTEGESDMNYIGDDFEDRLLLSHEERILPDCLSEAQRRRSHPFSIRALKRYFCPLWQGVYYKPLFHLVVMNFPYALAAWVYLFIFTLVRRFFPSSLSSAWMCGSVY